MRKLEENGLGGDGYFYGCDKNEDVTSKSDNAYMDMLNKITGSGNNVAQLLMGEDWDQELDGDYGDYTIPLMELMISYSQVTPL